MGGGYGMGGGGLLFMLVMAVLVVVPFWRLLPKFGIPNWVALAAIIPFGALVLLWVMAFRDKIDGGRT
ncbi:hypothetical protein [Roseovarius bejariae]|nr:hypothetical protein [Roseovarius bejariae]